MSSVTAYLEWVAPGAVEAQFTQPLYERKVSELSWESDSFDPQMLESGDSPILKELGERLKRSGLKVKVEVHKYKLRFELVSEFAVGAAMQLVERLEQVLEHLSDACWSCGAFNNITIKLKPHEYAA